MSDLPDARDCGGICTGGWILLDSHGAYAYLGRDEQPHTVATSAVARCLCPKGQALPTGYGRPIDQVVSEARLLELYPWGLPVVETPERIKRDAGIPKSRWLWSFETFKATLGKRKEITQHLVAAEAWVNAPSAARSDLVLYGPPGTGKSGLATAIALACIARHERPLFVEARVLFMDWRTTYGPSATEAETAFLARHVAVPVLILDEAGETQLTDFTLTGLKLLVDRRQGAEHPTIFTVNVPADATAPEKAMAHLSAVFGPALYDRLREHAQFWPLLGTSARKPATKVLPFRAEDPS